MFSPDGTLISASADPHCEALSCILTYFMLEREKNVIFFLFLAEAALISAPRYPIITI